MPDIVQNRPTTETYRRIYRDDESTRSLRPYAWSQTNRTFTMGAGCSVSVDLGAGVTLTATGNIPLRNPKIFGFWGDNKLLWKKKVKDLQGQIAYLPRPGAADDSPPLGLLYIVNGKLEMCNLKGKSMECPVDSSGLNCVRCVYVHTGAASIILAGGEADAGYWWCAYRIDEDGNWAKNEQHTLTNKPRGVCFLRGAGGISVAVDYGEKGLCLYDKEGKLLWSRTYTDIVRSTGSQQSASAECAMVYLDTAENCLRLLDINGAHQKMIPDDPSPAILCKPTTICFSRKCGTMFVGHKNMGKPAVGTVALIGLAVVTVPRYDNTVKPVPIEGLSGEITGMDLRDHKLAIACWDAEAKQGYLYLYYVV